MTRLALALALAALPASAETVALSANPYHHPDTAVIAVEPHVTTITYHNNLAHSSVSGLWPMPGTACTLHVAQGVGPETAWLECDGCQVEPAERVPVKDGDEAHFVVQCSARPAS